MQEMWVLSLGWEDPLEEGMAIHYSVLSGESHEQRSPLGYSPQGHKELDTTEVTSYMHYYDTHFSDEEMTKKYEIKFLSMARQEKFKYKNSPLPLGLPSAPPLCLVCLHYPWIKPSSSAGMAAQP